MGRVLDLAEGGYAVCRLPASSPVPDSVYTASGLVSVTATRDEVSVVCPEQVDVPHALRDGDWRLLSVRGPLDFALTGVLAGIAAPLADAGVPVFVVSTFDTDHVLVKRDQVDRAVLALRAAGHTVVTGNRASTVTGLSDG